MFVRDIMTTNVVTVSSNTVVPEAIDIMRAHHIERLPVVDRGKLVGIVTKDTLLRASPSPATSLSIHELSYLLSRLTVRELMEKKVVTISPNETVEAAISLAQGNRVGCTPVVEDDRVVGIVTSVDLICRILNPLMGIRNEGERIPGQRIIVYRCGSARDIEEVMGAIHKQGLEVKAACTVAPYEGVEADLLVHLDTEDASQVVGEIQNLGYKVEIRQR